MNFPSAESGYVMLTQLGSRAGTGGGNRPSEIAVMPVLVLNVHSRCNCRCVMCDIWKRDVSLEVRAADLAWHRESMQRLSVRWVVLSGGEPLLHSDLRSLCTFFRELQIKVTLLTTGLLLSKRAADVAELFDEVIVSLDGPSSVHDLIRGVAGGFDLIERGVGAVRRLGPGIRITARTTVQKANRCQLRATVAAAKRIGLDGVSFLAADVTSEAFNRPQLWPSERQDQIALKAPELSELNEEIEELISGHEGDIRTGYIAESPEKLRRITHHFAAHLGFVEPESPDCNAPWVSAVVEADGSVRPCFFHPAIGSLHGSTLEEVVNGETARSFRNSLIVAQDPTCRRCVCSLKLSREGTSHRSSIWGEELFSNMSLEVSR